MKKKVKSRLNRVYHAKGRVYYVYHDYYYDKAGNVTKVGNRKEVEVLS